MDKKEQRNEPAEETSDSNIRKFGLFTIILTDLISYIGGGFFLGYIAWAKLDAPWWVLLVFSLTGLILAFYKLYKISQKEL